MSFQEIKATELHGNVINEIGNKWMILSAGTERDFNFMTINWGMMGELWFKHAVTVYARESRLTKKYMEDNKYFTLTSLKPGNEKALQIAGAKSGRDIDKLSESGLTSVFIEDCPTFEEAEYTVLCKKIYSTDIKPENFTDKEFFKTAYEDEDYHTMYIGEIVKVFLNK